jgi:hypothetical protein
MKGRGKPGISPMHLSDGTTPVSIIPHTKRERE